MKLQDAISTVTDWITEYKEGRERTPKIKVVESIGKLIIEHFTPQYTKFETIQDNHPLDDALCVFESAKGFYFLGYMKDAGIKIYGSKRFFKELIPPEIALRYQYIHNNNGGLLFINKKSKK